MSSQNVMRESRAMRQAEVELMLREEWPGRAQTWHAVLEAMGRASRLKCVGLAGMGFAPAGVISRQAAERMAIDWRIWSVLILGVGDDIVVAGMSVGAACVWWLLLVSRFVKC